MDKQRVRAEMARDVLRERGDGTLAEVINMLLCNQEDYQEHTRLVELVSQAADLFCDVIDASRIDAKRGIVDPAEVWAEFRPRVEAWLAAESEEERMKELAEAEGLTLSEYMRRRSLRRRKPEGEKVER